MSAVLVFLSLITASSRVQAGPARGSDPSPTERLLAPAQGSTPCCTITAIDASKGVVTARETATRRTFQFSAPGQLVTRLRVGQGVSLDPRTQVVSVEGAPNCCKLLTASAVPPSGAPRLTTSPPLTKGDVHIDQFVQHVNWFVQHGGAFQPSADPTRPAILLVHGLHNNALAWMKPADDPAVDGYYYDHRHTPPPVVLANSYPGVGVYKEGKSERSREQFNANNWFEYLVKNNFTVATWSQPGETFNDAYYTSPRAVEAYNQFLTATLAMNPSAPPPVALIGYSRGGLLIRKLLKEEGSKGRVRWVITLHSPHGGSELARAPEKLLEEIGIKCGVTIPCLPALLLPPVRNMCRESLEALTQRLIRPGSRELTPGGPIVGPLAQGESPVPGVEYHTFGGTTPTYIRYYLWWFTAGSAVPQYKCDPAPTNCKQYFKWEAVPKEIAEISPMLDEIRDFAPEIKPGYGDGLVADAQARLPFATHTTDSLNHAEVLWNRALQQRVVRILSGPFKPTGTVGKP